MQRLIYVDYIWKHTPEPDLKQNNVLHFYPTSEINTNSPVPGFSDLSGNGSGLVVCRCDPGRCCQQLLEPPAVLPFTALGPTELPEPGHGAFSVLWIKHSENRFWQPHCCVSQHVTLQLWAAETAQVERCFWSWLLCSEWASRKCYAWSCGVGTPRMEESHWRAKTFYTGTGQA